MKHFLFVLLVSLPLVRPAAMDAAGDCTSSTTSSYGSIETLMLGPGPEVTTIKFPNGGETPYSPISMTIVNKYAKLVITINYPGDKEQTQTPSQANQILNQLCPGLGVVIPPSGKLVQPFSGPRTTSARPKQAPAATGDLIYGVGSQALVYTDLNGDGNPDLAQVQTNDSGGQVVVQILDGNGNTLSTNQYAVSSTSNEIVAGDFNGDGSLDLAVGDDGGGSTPGGIWILINQGNGTFKAAAKTPALAGPYHLFAADFNGDGKIDVAASNDQSPTVSVFLGKGDGTFQNPTSLGGLQGAGSLVAADFRGTGRADIAVIDYLADAVVVFPASADGTFQQSLSFSAGFGPGYLIYADVNNDGIPDLAAAYLNANSTVFLINDGKGGFNASPPYLTGAEPGSLALLDLDGAFALLSGDDLTKNVILQFGPGDGTLAAPQLQYTGQYPTAVATGDANGDGKDDAVVIEHVTSTGLGQDAVRVLLNKGNGTFASPVTYNVPSPTAAAFAVLTRGANPDLLVTSGTGNVEVLPNNGLGGFGAPVAFPAGSNPSALAVADLNDDGSLDVAVADGPGGTAAVSLLFGNGRGGLETSSTYLANQFANAIVSADLNHDGHPDLIVATGNANAGGNPLSVTVLLNQGSGSFTALAPIGLLPSGTASTNGIFQIVAGDFNGDGKMDLAVVETNGVSEIQILTGNGDGTFQTGALVPTKFGAKTAVAADLNGDGNLDLVVGHCCGETDDTYLLGNGDGTFQAEVEFPSGASPEALAIADWSGSGKADLAIAGQILQDQPGTKGFFVPLYNSFPPAVVSGASFKAGPLAPSEIVTLKGNLLASGTANVFPLPTTLEGATVTITDSAGNSQAAPLYYVSRQQINLEIPAGVAQGHGSVRLTQTDGTPVTAFVEFVNVAPGIFQLNSSNLAAAEALVVNGGRQTLQQVYQLGPSNSVIPLPIDLSQGKVYLELYGTGIRNATNVTVSVAGQNLPILFSGATGAYAGEDQVNAGPLPASLSGAGSVNIVLTADQVAANTVNVTIK